MEEILVHHGLPSLGECIVCYMGKLMAAWSLEIDLN